MFEKITPKLDLYEVNDWMGKKGYGIAIQLYEDGIPYARLTTSFGEFIGLKNAAYIDTNNFPKALNPEIYQKYSDKYDELMGYDEEVE